MNREDKIKVSWAPEDFPNRYKLGQPQCVFIRWNVMVVNGRWRMLRGSRSSAEWIKTIWRNIVQEARDVGRNQMIKVDDDDLRVMIVESVPDYVLFCRDYEGGRHHENN